MKKIIATLLALAMLLSLVSVPAMASDIAAGIHLAVEYDINTGILKLSGTMSEVAGRNWASFYMLYPGKTRADIPNHTQANPVFSYFPREHRSRWPTCRFLPQ